MQASDDAAVVQPPEVMCLPEPPEDDTSTPLPSTTTERSTSRNVYYEV
jgi:hypothetical protein